MKIVLDIETNSTHDNIWMCVTRNIETDEVQVWKAASGLQKYLENCDLIIMHNGINFDAPVLRKNWNVTMKLSQVYDTLIASRLLNPSLDGGHSLEAWGQRLGFPKGDFSDWDGGATQEMEEYCIQDTLVTAKLYNHLVSTLQLDKFSQRSIDLEHNVQAIITKQEENGFKLDEPKALQLLAELKAKLDVIQTEMQIIFPAKVESGRTTKRRASPSKTSSNPSTPVVASKSQNALSKKAGSRPSVPKKAASSSTKPSSKRSTTRKPKP